MVSGSKDRPVKRRRSGQATVETTPFLGFMLVLVLRFVQLAIIGAAALAVRDAGASCAWYGALNPGTEQGAVNAYLFLGSLNCSTPHNDLGGENHDQPMNKGRAA